MEDTVMKPEQESRFSLSGTAIKYIAAVLMVFDHLHQFFQLQGAPAWFNILGRPVLPIFLFMAVEGFCHTRSRSRYLIRLLLGFLLMNILNYVLSIGLPFNNTPVEKTPVLINNVFSTLLMTVFYLYAITILGSGVKEKKSGKIFCGILLLLLPIAVTGAVLAVTAMAANPFVLVLAIWIPNLLTVEGGFFMVLIGVLFYLLRRWRWAQMAVFAALCVWYFIAGLGSDYNIQWLMVLAIIPLMLYNGKRGSGRKFDKYFFYIFYPVHVYLFYITAWLLQR